MSAYAKIVDGKIADRRSKPTADGTWLPVVLERPEIDRDIYDETVQIIIEPDRVRQVYGSVPKAVTQDDVAAERDRRLALGINYDFGDARGVHRIGTTPADLAGWSEVTQYANALIDSGDTTTTIAIVTDTAPCLVTAPEWQAVMLSAAEFRQPLWAASFVLQIQSPIPASYKDDQHWT